MRISISPDAMVVDGVAQRIALPLPDGVRAMQWNGEGGFAERVDGIAPLVLADFQPWLDAYEQAAGRAPGRWRVLKSTLVDRMTENEAEQLDMVIGTLSTKKRMRWQAVRWVWNDDPDVAEAATALAWTSTRIAELLGPDPDAAGVT